VNKYTVIVQDGVSGYNHTFRQDARILEDAVSLTKLEATSWGVRKPIVLMAVDEEYDKEMLNR